MSFDKIFYKGKEVKDYTTAKTITIVMQKNHPDMLDMRFKCNRNFVAAIKPQKVINKTTPTQLQFINDSFIDLSTL